MAKDTDAYKYDVYISYNRQTDANLARDIAAHLSDNGLQVFLDEWRLVPGDPFSLTIEKALEDSRSLLAIVSKSGIKSPWVEQEWEAALTKESPRLLPLLVDDVTPPPFIRDIVSIHIDTKDSLSVETGMQQIADTINQLKGAKGKTDRNLATIREQSQSLPALDQRGFLPEGLHIASLEEVKERFGVGTNQRRLLARKLSSLSKRAYKMGAESLILGGSFISSDPNPRDLDVLIVISNPSSDKIIEKDVNVIQSYVASGKSTFIASDKESVERWIRFLENRFLSEPRGVVQINLSGGDK
jgi:hypothetical protein